MNSGLDKKTSSQSTTRQLLIILGVFLLHFSLLTIAQLFSLRYLLGTLNIIGIITVLPGAYFYGKRGGLLGGLTLLVGSTILVIIKFDTLGYDGLLFNIMGQGVIIFIALLLGHIRDLNISLQNEINERKLLTGLLPICSHCKNIRDDKGYWQRVEDYIKVHAGEEVIFSHGICPDCLKEKFPDAYRDMYGKKSKKKS